MTRAVFEPHWPQPPSQSFLTSFLDERARIWDAATGHALSPALSHRYGISWAAFSHDGRRVVTASEDRSALVWDAQSGQQLVPPLRHSAPVTMAVFSPDDHLLLTTSSEIVTSSHDGTARVWDLRPTSVPVSEIRRQAELLSVHRLDDRTGAVPLTVAEIKARWNLEPIHVPRPRTCNLLHFFR